MVYRKRVMLAAAVFLVTVVPCVRSAQTGLPTKTTYSLKNKSDKGIKVEMIFEYGRKEKSVEKKVQKNKSAHFSAVGTLKEIIISSAGKKGGAVLVTHTMPDQRNFRFSNKFVYDQGNLIQQKK